MCPLGSTTGGNTTPAPVCAQVATDGRVGGRRSRRVWSGNVRVPLTAGQLEIWISQILEPVGTAYNVGDYYEITGALDAALLQQATRTAVDEAGSLGARFVTEADGTPVQELGPAQWDFAVLDLSAAADPYAQAVAWMHADLARPVDLTTGPLIGAALIKVSADRHLWYRRVHHIVADGHGLAALARRTADLYNALHSGTCPEPSPFEPVTVAVEHDRTYTAGRTYRSDQEFWAKEAAAWPATGRLREDAPPASAARQGRHHLPTPAVAAIQEQSERLAVPPAHFLIAATALYLRQVAGADEVTFGCSVGGRSTRALRGVVAPLANILPLRVPVPPDASVRDAFAQADGRIRQAMRHHRYRYEEFRRALATVAGPGEPPGVGPLVNVVNFDRDLRLGEARGSVRTLTTGPVPDLSLFFDVRSPSEGTTVSVEANPATYSVEETDGHAEGLGRLVVELAAAEPGAPLPAPARRPG
ncbi:condensation domain-containing protein [Streptomyces lydicus]|uniref:condensation domain-containing protein n=1 Tax=Streptomyces lydicus TaxID=47763 RepID=UPI0036A85963